MTIGRVLQCPGDTLDRGGSRGGNRQRPRRCNIVLSRDFYIPTCLLSFVATKEGGEGWRRIPRDHARLRFPRFRARMANGGRGRRGRSRPRACSRSRLELTSNNGATLTRAPTCPIKGALFLPTGRDSTLPLLLLLLVMKIPRELPILSGDKIAFLLLFLSTVQRFVEETKQGRFGRRPFTPSRPTVSFSSLSMFLLDRYDERKEEEEARSVKFARQHTTTTTITTSFTTTRFALFARMSFGKAGATFEVYHVGCLL